MLNHGHRIGGKLLSKWLPYLYLLLAADAAFIFLHVLYLGRGRWQFNLSQEESYSETFQHYKEFLIVLLLVMLAMRWRSFLYLSWSLLFLYIWLDDTFMIHEVLGAVVGEKLALPHVFGLMQDDIGELIVWAFFGLFLLAAVATTYRFSRDRVTKRASRYLCMLLVIYAIPGVVLDVVHEMMLSNKAKRLLTIPEDGGELVALSIIVWFVLLQATTSSNMLPRSGQGENLGM